MSMWFVATSVGLELDVQKLTGRISRQIIVTSSRAMADALERPCCGTHGHARVGSEF